MDKSEKLKKVILSKYKSIREFSKEIGIPNSTLVSALDKGFGGMAVDKVIQICDSLNLDIKTFDSLDDMKNIERDFPTIPEHFTNPNMARAYVMQHQIFAASGFYPERMSDEDILNFANEIINQAELIGYKYKDK